MSNSLATLFFPFHHGLLDAPRAGERLVVFGAGAGLRLPPDFRSEIVAVQGLRPDYLSLERAGYKVTPTLEGENFDAAFVLLGRHRRENELQLAQSLACLKPGGLLAAAGAKKDGAASLAKRVAKLLPLENQLSKHHGVVFWARRPNTPDAVPLQALLAHPIRTGEGYETAIGGFSEGGVDPGSRLLADSLPDDISGSVADFGAGWGYLSLRLAKRFSLQMLDLYEAHNRSLDAARGNLAAHASETPCHFFWQDLLSEPVEQRYDVIVMNPPFHRGRAAEPDLGQAMILAASKAVKPRGRLFLVANRALPYETVVKANFTRQGEICRDSSFKVLWAVK
ncbi:class I SAM-dependent methyltransferase [Chelativorans sp. YIM 93263]|uniref:class I SAM-dependent methyltransferase n=1 Tax=Chelativorans sp. YIM 93263 TaxID=2906648 RepID=UPI002379B6F8|nr:class I SAM-dependent methyltransferase [Chelativorans sp. YIM 93263]